MVGYRHADTVVGVFCDCDGSRGNSRSSARVGIDPSTATLEVTPVRVGWREPLTVSVRTSASVAIPFLFSAAIPLRTTTVVRGELAR